MQQSGPRPLLTEADIDALISEMTLEEKAGQLNQPPNLDQITDEQIRTGQIGSVICAYNAFAGNEKHHRVRVEKVNRLQSLAVNESRLGIPLIFARDVVHGYRTVAPIPLGQAASFSPEHVRAAQEIAAMEASADGIRWFFTPMLDIARDPRWGRVAEGYGEDPFLAEVMAVAAVHGLQGDDPTQLDRGAACIKHFAGYGAAEGGRDYNTGEISEHTYRNLYLRPFHAAIKAGALSVMAAFLEVGGEPASCNDWLMTKVLREEWGFDGPVVSDWNAVAEIIAHGRAEDSAEATRLALSAGTDIDMAAEAYLKCVPALVESGQLPISILDEAVRRVLRLKMRLGIFANPFVLELEGDSKQFSAKSQQTTLELAHRSLVLLQNREQLLPLRAHQRVVLIGELARTQRELFGTWTLDGVDADVVTIADALRRTLPEGCELHEPMHPDEAVRTARTADVAVVVVGEAALRSGEDNCVADIGLPAGQLDLIRAVRRTGVPVVAVILTGRPLDLSEVCALADAVVLAFHPGVMGGIAIADTLVGNNNPSGKLPITFPRSVGQIPVYYNRKATGRPTDLTKRQTSRLIDLNDSPLFAFGEGHGYSPLEYSNAKISEWKISVEVHNQGPIDAEEIVQLYIRDEVAERVRPVRELVGFQRIPIAAGKRETASFTLTPDMLGYYGAGGKWVIEPGSFTLAIGPNSLCPDFARVRLGQDLQIENVETL